MSPPEEIDYILDTNVVIHTLEGLLRRPLDDGAAYGLSTVSKLELLGTPNLSAESERTRIAFMDKLVLLPIDDAIIDEAIHLRRHRNLRTPDAIIAATAMHYNAILLTNDVELLRALGPIAQAVPLVPTP